MHPRKTARRIRRVFLHHPASCVSHRAALVWNGSVAISPPYPLTRLLCIPPLCGRNSLHEIVCSIDGTSRICCKGGAPSWGFAQQTTTNGALSLDSPSARSIEWQQLARRTSPPKGFGRAQSSGFPATTRAAPEGFYIGRIRAALQPGLNGFLSAKLCAYNLRP